MRAVVKTEFFGVRDGEAHPAKIEVGTEVSGDLAEVAVRNGWADEVRVQEAKAEPRQKAKK